MKHNRTIFLGGFLIFLLGGLFLPVFAQESTESGPASTPVKIFSFAEHLFGSETSIFLKNKSEISGVWNEDAFEFKDFPPGAAVKTVVVALEDHSQKAISLNPVPGAIRRLRFLDVPLGSKLIIYYKVEAQPSKEISYMYFHVYAGKHELKRFRISTDDQDWEKKELDLGVASFLGRGLPVTFELATNTAKVQFLFCSEIV